MGDTISDWKAFAAKARKSIYYKVAMFESKQGLRRDRRNGRKGKKQPNPSPERTRQIAAAIAKRSSSC